MIRVEPKDMPVKKERLTPQEHVYGQRLAERPALQQEVGRELAHEIREIEDGREPRVLLIDETGIFNHSEDGLCAKGSLVRLLNAIAEPLVDVRYKLFQVE